MTKKVVSIFVLAVLIPAFILPGSGLARNSSQTTPPPTAAPSAAAEFVADQVLARFKPGVTPQQADRVLAEQGLMRLRRIPALEIEVLQLPPGLTVERAVEVLSHRPAVAYAEPNYILHALALSKAEVDDQWGLIKIQAPDAWAEITDPKSALLAIVDTGIDRFHSDLADNIWSNPGEIPGNGLDDDGNGLVDDSWGWDFVNGDNDPMDDMFHGTAVSSVAAGDQDTSGVAGVCPWCTLAAVKVLGADGSGTLDVVASGITYATDIGARVINLSLAGIIGSPALQSAVDYAWQNGALVVAAAGNDGADMPVYPAAYANAMAVASTNEQDYRSCFSNYGQDYISVAAPGEAILTATPNQGYGTYSGTSLSAPHVTGLGGLLFSQDSSRSNVLVRELIEATTNDLGPVGTDAFFGTGRINADRAVMDETTATDPPPGMFSDDLSTTGYGNTRKLARDSNGDLHMIWHAKNGAQYQILYAHSSDSGASWSQPEVVFESADKTYHAALAIDEDLNNLYVAFPSMHNASNTYRTYFTKKPLSGGEWSTAEALMGGAYDAVRPALYYDPSGQRLHLVAASYDNAPYVYHTSSGDGGESWSPIQSVNMVENTRYAAIHANGSNVYLAARTVEFTWFGLLPVFRVRTIRSTDGGLAWSDLTELAKSPLGAMADYGLSLAGAGDRLYLTYENAGGINFQLSQDGITWSAAESLGAGAWPSVTQAAGGQAWALWDNGGTINLRHYSGAVWEAAAALGAGNYPNLKLGTSDGVVEWAYTHCSGAPFRLAYGSRTLGGNVPPQVDDQAVTTDEEVPRDITLTGSDADGDPLTFSVVSGPPHGTLSGSPPNLIYTPDLNYSGADSFKFKANDGIADSNTATVSITVNPVNDPPVADDLGVTTAEDTAAGVMLSGSDPEGDAVAFSVIGAPGRGVLSGTEPDLTYTPNGDFNGVDSFTFQVCETGTVELLCSAVATVRITVTPVNDAPVAGDDSATVAEGGSVAVLDSTASSLLANDSDVENDNLEVTGTAVSGPSHGSVVLNADGSFSYSHDGSETSSDSFVYEVCDDGTPSACDTGTVSIKVNPVNDPPVADDLSVTTEEDTLAAITLTGSDADGDSLAFNVVAGPYHGTLSGSPPNLNYTPDTDFNGDDTFTYTANDGTVDSNTATVSIAVNAVNDRPVVAINSPAEGGTYNQGEFIAFSGSASDVEDGDISASLSWTSDLDGTVGTGGSFSTTALSAGTHTITAEATDSGGLSGSDEIVITVNPAMTAIDAVAIGDIFVAGTVSGDYTDTAENDGIIESITEQESGGKPANRYSYLEHKWIFNVSAGNIVTLYANAWRSDSGEGDSFIFAYSTDDVTYTDMFTVESTSDGAPLTHVLPSSTQGTVYVRVTDSDQSVGNRALDTIFVDQLYIRSETQAGSPPAAPLGLSATAISANQINLEWIDNATNEDGYFIERSEDGSNWTLIDTVGAGVTTYTDSTVFPSTTYDYRVQAYNASGSSAYSKTATVTTLAGLSLNGTGYKVKGVQTVDLSWSGSIATSFDVYRDGNWIVSIDSSVEGYAYTDRIGKGSGSYQYQVCEAGSLIDCSNMVEIGF